jgi:uncharacterized membrane protein
MTRTVAPALHLGGRDDALTRIEGSHLMERMLAVVFDSRAKAYEGSDALDGLEDRSVIAIYDSAVVTKDGESVIEVVKTHDPVPEGAMGATAVGSLIGLLGGPVGLAVGAVSGFAVGATADVARARVARDFVGDVERALLPGRAALVAEIDEESTEPVDASMHALGGLVFRRAQSDAADSAYEQEVAALEADIARMKARHAASRAERKGTLQARIDSLHEKLRHALGRAKAERDAIKREDAAKVQ